MVKVEAWVTTHPMDRPLLRCRQVVGCWITPAREHAVHTRVRRDVEYSLNYSVRDMACCPDITYCLDEHIRRHIDPNGDE